MNIYKPEQNLAEKNKKRNRMPLTELTKALSDITDRSKSYHFEERCSDSPLVDSIWRTPIAISSPPRSDKNGPYIFPAVQQWGVVVVRHEGKSTVKIWGPGTKAAPAPCPREVGTFWHYF